MRRQLESLGADDRWWNEWFPVEEQALPAKQGACPRWAAAFCAAAAVHIAVFGALSFPHRDGVDSPSPGADATAMDVVVLPAWPEPGHHPSQLGVASVAAASAPLIAPPALIAAASAADRVSDQNLPKPSPVSTDITKTALIVNTVESTPSPPADLPPSVPSAAEALWEGDVLAKLSSLKRYPAGARRGGQQDTVMVRFVVDRSGQPLSAEVIKSNGFALLDDEAKALIRRAAPLPAPPAEVSGDAIELIAPIQFVLRNAR
jgi:protein TonB